MHLVIYGPEGSGKGTQAKLLGELLKLPIYSTGDLVRETATKDKGRLGESCRKILTQGYYLSDREIFILLRNKLKTKEAKEGFILDGFPRTLKQAKFLLKEVKKYGYQIDRFIYLNITDKEAMKRLVKRKRKLYEGSCELHDTPKRIMQRLKIYRDQEKEILGLFRKKNIILSVDGSKTQDKVFSTVIKGLNIER